MHIALTLLVILIVWKWGDWRNWKKYHSTMLYVALGNLLYNLLTANYFLWKLEPDFLPNHVLTEMLYTFIVFPGSVILFLGYFPEGQKKQALHILKWILVYFLVEVFFLQVGRIYYQYGWSIWFSLAFLFVMFPFIRLHYSRPLLTYALTVIFVVVVVWWFEIPVHIPVEQRHLIN